MFQQEEVGGRAMVDADQLDLEAAEQLIQLSGGDGGSESRSSDSVKCRDAADRAGVRDKEKEEAVESRRRSPAGRIAAGKDGEIAAGEPDRKIADSVSKCSSREAAGTEEESAVESRRRNAGVVAGGEERRRPRFRWLADIYRETRQITARDPGAAGGNSGPPEAERRKRKRPADEEVVVPVVSKFETKARTMVA
ncbi:hypothetical protein QOZ80_5BG0419270 [Eleusine coracana subsp. coracana]|nr:hypothetical protein QOZ80_5BG0419270 [Eleusine coracana subsp. coracana]